VRKQVALVILLMLAFAGAGSSAIVTRALAGPKALSAAQEEKVLGPNPIPRWYWRWVEWRLGEGYARGHQRQRELRPLAAPRSIPDWAWQRLHFFLLARNQGLAVPAHQHPPKHGPPPTTTTSTTTSTTTATTTTPTTTTGTTTTGTTTTTPSGGETYEQAISYTQTRPSFTPSRTVNVSNASQLQAALSNLQPGDLVQATGSFTVNGSTVINNRLSSPAELNLTGVQFLYSGGQNTPAVMVNNASNLYIFGGDASTADTGGQGILVYGSQHVLWWGFTIHDTGSTGFAARAINGPVDHDDFQGTISKIGQNLAWDTHCVNECGTGLHGANLWDGATAGNFSNNRFAFYAHDIPTGACVEVGNNQPTSQATGNVLYLKCVNETEVSLRQTGGNGLQLWGDTDTLGLDVRYLEVDNAQGRALDCQGLSVGQSVAGVTVEQGEAADTNQNSQLNEPNNNRPWDWRGGVGYQNVLPSPTG
jgi:hypothetical protein